MTAPLTWSKPTTYTVCAVPDDVQDWYVFAVTVEETAPDRWAVRRSKRCLNADGDWEWEAIPSERADDFLARCRFDLETALNMARAVAPDIRVNGFTAARAAVEWAKETT